MKIWVNILVLLFFTFLATPTIVSILEDDTDVSVVYSFSEEEMHKDIKQLKTNSHYIHEFAFLPLTKKSTLIKSKNLQKHNNVSGDIFSPPPEFIQYLYSPYWGLV